MKYFSRSILFAILIILGLIGIGQVENPLPPCPDSPNCVSTYALKKRKKFDPLPFAGSIQETKKKLRQVILTMEGVKILEEREDYVHATFTTRLGKFIDDVEFYFDKEQKIVHFRSASQIGYSDLGANKRRMKKISKAWNR